MLAKIASDWNKPSGVKVILPEEAAIFMRDLKLRKIPGIGPTSEEKLRRLGFQTCKDIQRQNRDEIVAKLGERFGAWLYARSLVKTIVPSKRAGSGNPLAMRILFPMT